MGKERGEDDEVRFGPEPKRHACGVGELRDESLLEEEEGGGAEGIEKDNGIQRGKASC